MLILLYTGPGLGAGVVATVLGIVGSLFLALFAVVWYPVKRLWKKMRPAQVADADAPAQTEGSPQ